MKTYILIIFLAFVAIGAAEDQQSKPPKEIQDVITWIVTKQGKFDPTFLPIVKDGYKVRKSMTKDFMFYTIHPPKGAMDGFSHEICYNGISNQFWILRSGGEAGVIILYGPGKIDKKSANQSLQLSTRSGTPRAS